MSHHIKQYNDWHPFLHTALIELSSTIADTPATYIILQVVFAVSVIAYALWTLQSFGAPRWVTIALTLAYAAYPASAFFSVTMWKDFPFAYLVLLTTTMFAWIVRTRGDWLRRPGAVVALSLTCFATMHIRSNGLPAILLALVVAVVFLRPVRRRLALITGALVAAHLAWSGILLPRLHVLGPPATEALAIPTQQIGATYARAGVIAPEVGAYFNRILPAERWRAGYRTDITDPIKNNGLYRDEVIAESFPTYLANWARLLADNPSIFIRAFLDQTAALWQYTPSPPDARVYVGTSTELQDYSIHRRLLQRTSTAFPPFGTHADAIGLLYLEYNPHGCAPADQSCRPADRSDCFGEPACVTRTDFAIRTLASQRPLATSPLSQKLKAAYDTQYEHLSTDWQGPLARGAIPLFLLVLSIVIALRRQRLRALVFAPAIWVALSVAAAMPATDLRYAYGWIISIPFLLVLALLPTPDPDTSPADDLTTAHAPEATPATSGPGAPG